MDLYVQLTAGYLVVVVLASFGLRRVMRNDRRRREESALAAAAQVDRVAAGWRRCPRGGGRPHLWNLHTTALALHPQPGDEAPLLLEPCPWHLSKVERRAVLRREVDA